MAGLTALSHGEVNFRTNVPLDDRGLQARSDPSAPDKWVVRMALPPASIVPGAVAPTGSST